MEMEFQSVKEELNILKESLKSDALDHQSRNHFQAVWCGYHGGVLHSGENVTYDNIFTSDTTNLDDMEITGLNPSTGEFVSDFSETWMISVTVASGVDAGQENLLHLYLNGQRVEESAIRTYRNDWAPSYTAVTGGRTLFLSLSEGDSVILHADKITGSVSQVTTCFQLAGI